MPRMATSRPASSSVLRRLRPVFRALVQDVARYVVRAQARLAPTEVRDKGVGDYVTRIDLEAERRLRIGLLRALPEAGFLGEESTPSGLEREWVFVVDPVDGTSNYARGHTCFCVAVALLRHGQPVLACIHREPEGVLYEAVRGGGAFRSGRRLRLRADAGALDDRGIVGVQWFRRPRPADLEFVLRLQERGARVRLLGSTVAQILDVAAGRLDANVQAPGRLWDLAAPCLVASEAGARCTDWRGRPLFPVRDFAVRHQPSLVAPPLAWRKLRRWLAELPNPVVVPLA